MALISKLVLVIALLFGVTGCSTATEDEVMTMEEMYTQLDENHVYTIGDHDSVEKMLYHGTGVVFFGFPECPWCQRYVPMLNDIASDAGVNILYYNIYTDKSEDRAWYDTIASWMDEKNSDITHYDNDGNMVIYMPLVLFVQDGEIIGFDDETCDLDSEVIAVEDYWTEEKVEEFNLRIGTMMTNMRQLQDDKNSQGCAIKVEPDCDSDAE